ncbi:hypothetical protein BXZ70DRAFT_956127 [Cristinia sonorae]|uniref:Uncharacterized protein n=1 Tax=Cristinia sonorae TaxID=1940300 RepID=A0A8K0UH14_9AGAR|nr:hypothetical protein BXZ70DRAFT_956127 [Cristinia sonorae]
MRPLRSYGFTTLLVGIFTLCVWLQTPPALAALVNVTVDDDGADAITQSRIVYTPPDIWNKGQDCQGCLAHPDSSYLNTWHDGTFKPTTPNLLLFASFQFEGSALYVYCILAPDEPRLLSASDMTFFIDDEQVGTFVQIPTQVTQYTRDVLVYSNTTLPYGKHTFMLQNGHKDSKVGTLTMLDYLVYTHDNGTSTAPPFNPTDDKSNSKLTIIIPAIACVITIGLVVAGIFWWRSRRSRRRRRQGRVDLIQFDPEPVSYTSPVPPITSGRPFGAGFTSDSKRGLEAAVSVEDPSEVDVMMAGSSRGASSSAVGTHTEQPPPMYEP